jgi:hypothetical protein
MADAQNNWKAYQLRSRAGRLRRLVVTANIPAIAASLRRLAALLERLARKFD